MDTGKKIKLIRTFRGLTQKELGEACGIHEVAIRKYELGKNLPKPEQLRKIAEALNVNVNSLIEFDIEADGDVLPLLFAIDEAFDISIKDIDGEPGIFFSNKNLLQFLKEVRYLLCNKDSHGKSKNREQIVNCPSEVPCHYMLTHQDHIAGLRICEYISSQNICICILKASR